MKYLVIIPTKNNYKTILQVVDDIKLHAPFVDYLIVDYGSTDLTHHLLKNSKLRHIQFPIDSTYDKAMQLGLKFALTKNYDAVIEWSALGKFQAKDLIYATRVFNNTNVDILLGTRYLDKKPSFWNIQRRYLSRAIWLATFKSISDPVLDFKIVGKQAMNYLEKFSYIYYGPSTIPQLLKAGMTYKQIGIEVKKEVHRKEKKGFLYTIRNILFIILVKPLKKGRM